MRKYGYMYNSNNVLTFIDDAVKGERYTNLEGIKFIVRDGEERIKHYSIKKGLDNLSFSSAGGGESPQHWWAKMKIVYELKYYDDIFNQYVHFAKVVPEKGINYKIPDLSCYDEKDNLVMLIEIKCTNEKSIEDIEKLSVNKVPLIEIDIKNDNKCKHLILPTLLETNRKENERIQRLFKESSKGFKEKIEQAEREYEKYAEKYSPDINSFREGIRELEDGMQSKGTGRNREMESSKESIRDGIRERKQRGSEIKNDIKSFKRRISNNNEATFKNEYRLGKIRSEIDAVEIGIKERRNNIKKIAKESKIEWFRSSWMKNPVGNKEEEIRYWCS